MIMSKYPRGSEWRKWDLHIHSPSSIVQDYGNNNWDKFIKSIEKLPAEVKVIGLTDYYFIDGYEKLVNEKLSKNRLTNIDKIFPILEFRIDTFGSASESKFQKINLHILFDIDENNIKAEIEKIKKEFIEQIHITKLKKHSTKILSKENFINCSSNNTLKTGFDELIPNTEEVFNLIQSDTWQNKILTFLGYKEWNNLDKGKQLKIFKEDLCNKVKIFFSASKLDAIEKKNDILKEYGDKILLLSNDIHSFDKLENYECYTWIKSDPTFEGLKQILYEPERVFIGEKPHKLNYVEQNKDLFIDSVRIISNSDADEWFDKITEEIKLNPGLVSIIGNKGHGKSALSDILGNLSNYDTKVYSFLHRNRFLKFPRNWKYESEIFYKDNFSNKKALADTKYDSTKNTKAVYLSQHFVNNICEDLESSLLQKQIDQVIFSYVPEEEKLGYTNLADLIDYKTKVIDEKISKQKEKLFDINDEIAILENRKSQKGIEKIEEHLKEKNRQLNEYKSNPVKKLKRPKGSSKSALFDKLNKDIKKHKGDVTRLQNQLNNITKEKEKLKEIKDAFQLIETSIKDNINSYKNNKIVKKYKINLLNDFTYSFNYTNLNDKIRELNTEIAQINNRKKESNSLIKSVSDKLSQEQNELTRADREYRDSIDVYKNWEQKIKEINGDTKTPDTIKYYKNELDFIQKKVEPLLKKKRDERKDIITNLLNLIFEKKKIYPLVFQTAQDYAKSRAQEFNIKDEFIDFDSKVKIKKSFEDDFYNLINRGFTGTFCHDGSKEVLKDNITHLPLQSEEQLISFANKLEDLIKKDYRSPEENRDELEFDILVCQLKDNSLKDFYDFIYSFDYLETKSEITFGGKRLDELSPGERGTLLLIFYLLIDPDKKPIIIDQPEENLDNETVFLKIVPFIKKIKEERQIIIVTHNPNLAIVCDSEQIIHAYMDKKNNNLVTYNSGSIEYHGIRDKAIAILEGTEPAFINRKEKYAIR